MVRAFLKGLVAGLICWLAMAALTYTPGLYTYGVFPDFCPGAVGLLLCLAVFIRSLPHSSELEPPDEL
jgi:hypothetical protein